MMSEVMIEMKNIHKKFGSNHVLKGVDLTVNEGEAGGDPFCGEHLPFSEQHVLSC